MKSWGVGCAAATFATKNDPALPMVEGTTNIVANHALPVNKASLWQLTRALELPTMISTSTRDCAIGESNFMGRLPKDTDYMLATNNVKKGKCPNEDDEDDYTVTANNIK